MSEAIHTALSALRANLAKLDVTANNLANAGTRDFKKTRALSRRRRGGVKVTLTRVETPGTPLPPDGVPGKAARCRTSPRRRNSST
jgi:flagellar basal body rod protein FlgG